MMKRMESTYDTRCCKCSGAIAVGQSMVYDPAAARGHRSYCDPCGTAAWKAAETAASNDPAAELARLKAEVAKLADKSEPAPVAAKPSDPLAEAIAKAVEPLIAGKLDESRVRDIAARMIADYMTPPTTVIEVKRPDGVSVNMGRQHRQFAQLLQACTAKTKDGLRLNVSMTGSAGTGKTTAAHNVAKALGLEFSATGSLTDTYKIFGFVKPADGGAIMTAFRDRWTKGGVFLFDDFDASDPAAAVEANHPLANGHYTFPDGQTVTRHEDCILIMTMNTWGHGASDDYVGRVKQDKAFLDRFVMIEWGIDEEMERDTCSNKAWVTYVQKVRANVKRLALKVLVTPRATYYGESLLAVGMDMETVKSMTIRKGMTAEQWSAVC